MLRSAICSSAREGYNPPIMTSLTDTLRAAEEIARGAGAILREGARLADFSVDFKSSAIDPVTEYDRRSEAYIVGELRRRFPQDSIVGEEGGTYARQHATDSGRRWHIDPLDGTVNFSHGLPQFSVSIGMEDAQGLAIGVVYNPMVDELFAAARGQGATLNGRPIRPSRATELQRALLITGFPYDRHTSEVNNFDNFVAFKRRVQAVRRLGSAALDLCYVACGRADGYWELKLGNHDMAAGIVVVREAGGVVTDFVGGDALFARREAVASNGLIQAAMLEVLAEASRTMTPPPITSSPE